LSEDQVPSGTGEEGRRGRREAAKERQTEVEVEVRTR
jgi:hypothetical protein